MNDQKIIDLYTKEKKSTHEIAKMLDTYPNKIRRVLLKHGIHLKDRSEAQKNAILNGSAKIPTKGKKRSQEEKLRISQSLSHYWENMSDQEYSDVVSCAKQRWSQMSEQEKTNMYNAAITAIQTAGKEGSKLEKYLLKELTKGGYKVDFHKKGLIPNHKLEIDLYLPELRAIIEVDGPSHFLPIWGEEKLQKQIKADEQKTGLILSKGFIVIRIKNLSDSVSLHAQENLKNSLIETLNRIKVKPPKDLERYIEITI